MKDTTPRSILITFDISSIAGRDQLAGVLKYMHKRPDWIPRILSTPAEFTPEVLKSAKADGVAGIIVNHVGNAETEAALVASDIPLAVIGIRNPRLEGRGKSIAFVHNDNVETGRVAARHFRTVGKFKSFGFIPAAESEGEWSASREEGFRAELASSGCGLSVFDAGTSAGTVDEGRALAEWLKGLEKPAAVFAAWDHLALMALNVCRAEGIRIPNDVAVLGVDNDPILCETSRPQLASIPFDYERQGYESAAALASLIDGAAETPKTAVCHPLPVMVRASAERPAPASEVLKKAMRFISQNATKGISSRDITKALGISASLLTLRFREVSGGTAMDAILAVRIEKAKQLLVETDKPISDITSVSGFRNANYMKKVFKRRTGLSMREYRAKFRPL